LDLLAEDNVDDCRAFLNAICNFQATGLLLLSLAHFSLHVSALIYMCATRGCPDV
jgi:hypothetical protein